MPDGGQVFAAGWSEGWAPASHTNVCDWAEEHVKLPAKGALEYGDYRVDRTPYVREPLECLSVHSAVEEIVLMWGSQTGKTTVVMIGTGYWIDVDPSPMLSVLPTLDFLRDYNREKLEPLIDSCAVIKAKIAPKRSRDESNTSTYKDFRGGFLALTVASTAKGLRGKSVRYLTLDEVDSYEKDVGGEGDPVSLSKKRQTTAARRKRIITSTPLDEVGSRIDPAYKASDACKYHVACPHCGEWQPLVWGNLKFPGGPKSAHYVCAAHACVIEEHHKPQMLRDGQWVATNPAATGEVRGFHLNSLYAPIGWVSWAELAAEFLEAKERLDQGDVSLMKVFINTRLAEVWKEAGEQYDAHDLQKRAEPYELGTVPAGVLILTASADVQGNRIEVELDGWSRGEENWTCDYVVFWGEPADLLSRKDARLDEYLRRTFTNVHGHDLRIAAVAIDSGGHHTADVYMFCRGLRHRHVFAVKGASVANRPILSKPTAVDIDYRGTKIKGGGQVWSVGTDTAKELIYGRLKVGVPGPGYMHFSNELAGEYYKGLTAERLVTRYKRGRARREWVLPPGQRNEPLDLKVYNVAAAQYAGLFRMKAAQWDKLERQYGPSLFTQPIPTQQQPPPPAASPAQDSSGPQVIASEEAPAVRVQASAKPVPQRKTRSPRRGGSFVKGWK